ncbi:hypothetical protein CMK18_20610 [Candidatus Poribacteria bacterium]|nr:hypothetical protein [Candidatus Poribacteria bacterium]
MSSKFTDYNIDPTGYAAFDATSLKSLILDRLKEQGVFTDQVFEGSNLSSIIDIVAYSYHTLMFYLNRTASETMFSDTQLYENMNRVVKLLNYKPVGYQTSVVSFESSISADLDIGTYVLPRYSSVNADGIPYVLNKDIIFTKPTVNETNLKDVNGNFLLYQGEVVEYPRHTASGNASETVVLSVDPRAVRIDHFSIGVYVKSSSGISEYNEVDSLYTESPGSLSYELRLNENYRYEIQFGDNINGRRLESGDVVYIYYIKSLGTPGIIPAEKLNTSKITLHTTPQFNDIKESIYSPTDQLLDFQTVEYLSVTNPVGSTTPKDPETVEEIRRRAPKYFQSQDRLITTDDFTTHVKRYYGNIINDVITVNNKTYLNGHIKYLHEDIGISNPTLESRVLYNQSKFSTSTNFNNVYLYVVPRVSKKTSINIQANFVPSSQKEIIKTNLDPKKAIGLDITFMDPVYMAVDIGTGSSTITASTPSECSLEITKSDDSVNAIASIKKSVTDIMFEYFKLENCSLGQLIDVDALESSILSIDGVSKIRTVNNTTGESTNGLSLIVWNPVYEGQDIQRYNQNIQLPYYKFPYYYDELSLLSRINVVTD